MGFGQVGEFLIRGRFWIVSQYMWLPFFHRFLLTSFVGPVPSKSWLNFIKTPGGTHFFDVRYEASFLRLISGKF